MADDQFSLVWNSFPTNLSSGLYTLLTDEQLVDVTLAAEGQILRAHKLILSVCSTYFRDLFKMNSCKHPIVILKDVNYRDLSAMLHFMYQGEVNIKQEDLASFLKVAETLQIKGLTKDKSQKEDPSIITGVTSARLENLQEQSGDFESSFDSNLLSKLESKTVEPQKLLVHDQKSVSEPSETNNSSLNLLPAKANEAPRSDNTDEQSKAMEGDSIIREILTTASVEMRCPTDEPLDYTSVIGRLSKTKIEPLDYTSDIDFDIVCNKTQGEQDNLSTDPRHNLQTQNNSVTSECLSISQFVPYNPGNQEEPLPTFSHLEAFRTDFPYDDANYTRGRRTVKGISGSSLPLETTLRVVSEMGPTLRVERGKVIRMYSCPWCLRHFTRKENLKLHVRYIHGPLESLTCKLCGNKYKNSNSLRVHSYLYHNTKRNKHGKPALVNSGGT